MRSLVVVILFLLPAVAYAAPVLGFLASPALFAGTAYAVSWGAVIFTAASVLYGQATQRKQAAAAKKAQKKARDEFNASLRDRTITGIATERPHTYIYGRARVGSNVVAMFNSGAKDEYKHLVCVLAQHECEAIDEIYINGTALGTLDGNGGVTSGIFLKADTAKYNTHSTSTTFAIDHVPNTGTLSVFKSVTITYDSGSSISTTPVAYSIVGTNITITAPVVGASYTATYQYTTYTSMIRVVKHLGGATDPADANMMAELGTKWPATAVLRGHCYLAVRLNLNQAEFQGGLPQLEALVRGKKLYDPRTGLTTYSSNNALVAYDYLTSEMGGVSASSIPVSTYISAANDCDDAVSVGTWSGPRYTFNGTITSDQSRDNVLEKIAQSMAGGIVATTWDCYAGKYSAPVMALHQSDIVGNVAISPGFALNEVYNTVRGQFISADNKYVATDFKPYVNAAYLASDGEELTTDIDLPYTDEQQRCTNLARIFTEDNRNSFSISGKFSLKAFGLKVGQRATFTAEFFGQSAKVFRVTDKSFAPDKAVQLGLKEDAASIYDLADETAVDATPNTDFPNPFLIDDLASLTCTSSEDTITRNTEGVSVSRILAEWPIATTQGVLQNGSIEIEWQAVNSDVWQKASANGYDTSAYLSPVSDGQFYTVRARCVNPYVGTKSDWVYSDIHQVTGRTTPPPYVDRFKLIEQPGGIKQFFWSMDFVPNDLFAFEVRYSLGSTIRPWEQMLTLFSKDYRANSHENNEPASAEIYTFAIRAVDDGGRMSEVPHYITEAIDGDKFGPVAAFVLPHQDGWPGTKTDCYVDITDLTGEGSLTWNDFDIAWGDTDETWGNTSGPFSYEHPVVDLTTVAARTIRANALVAGSVLIEMSTSDDDVSYSAWGEIPATTVSARYHKFRWSVTGANSRMYRAQAIFYT